MRGFFICFLLIAILLPVNGYSLGQFVNKDLVITKDYRFSKPDINQIKNTEFDRINLEKLPVESIPDLPVLPVKPLKILIPFGYEVINFEVENSKRKKVNGFYKIEFGDDIIPYSFKREELKNHRNFFKIDKKSPAIYKSQKPYPGRNYSSFNVQNLRGYQILCVKIHPLSYIPASGEITYASELKLRITCRKNNKRNDMLRNVRTDIELVKKFVDDPETLATYPDIKKNEGNAKYLIITNKALKAIEGQYTFNTLAEFLKTQGLTVKIVDVESIVEQTSGIDKQMKIRNYIKSAYKNWGTEFVLLGGDSDKNGEGNVIPIRSLYAIFTWEGRTFEEDLPADVYYSCLNGTFNFDKDNHYGEIGDDENGGEVDLLAEVFVGRAPVSNAEQL